MLETYKILRNVVSFFSWIKAGNNRGVLNPFFLLFCERNKINRGFVAFGGSFEGPRLFLFNSAP